MDFHFSGPVLFLANDVANKEIIFKKYRRGGVKMAEE